MDSKYARVVSADEKERLPRGSGETETTLLEHGAGSDDAVLMEGGRRAGARLGPVWLWMLHIGLLFMSLTFFVLAATVGPTTRAYVDRFSAYSPAAAAVEYQTVTFNGSKVTTPFVGAGEAADKAWDHVTQHMGDQMVSADELSLLGKPLNRLRVKDPKTAEIGFRVELAVVHQLHCLNLLRKVVHKHYYEPLGGDLAVPVEKLQGHLNHCIEALRQKVMCEADVGVLTFYKEPNADGKMEPDYESQHVCRNFDKIREWAVENTVAKKVAF